MVNKKLINGLKYEKLSEEQLYDLSSWELVDIILAYRKDYKAKEQECEKLKLDLIEAKAHRDYLNNLALSKTLNLVSEQLDQLKAENETYKKMLKNEDVQLALNEVRTGERHLWFNKAEKYKQALTKIKKILLFNKKELEECLYNDIDGQILKIINEVENGI